MKGANVSCLKISNIPYNSIFPQNVHDSSILISIISGTYLNLFVRMNALAMSQYQPRLSCITNFAPANPLAVFAYIINIVSVNNKKLSRHDIAEILLKLALNTNQ